MCPRRDSLPNNVRHQQQWASNQPCGRLNSTTETSATETNCRGCRCQLLGGGWRTRYCGYHHTQRRRPSKKCLTYKYVPSSPPESPPRGRPRTRRALRRTRCRPLSPRASPAGRVRSSSRTSTDPVSGALHLRPPRCCHFLRGRE